MDMNEGAVMGYFNGAPGTFECRSTECSLETDADGKLETVGGTWWFTPDEGAMVDVDDADYMRYGFWLKRTTDADGAITYDEVETFSTRPPPAARSRSRRWTQAVAALMKSRAPQSITAAPQACT